MLKVSRVYFTLALSPALGGADEVLFIAAGAGFREAGDGRRVSEQQRAWINLNTQKHTERVSTVTRAHAEEDSERDL